MEFCNIGLFPSGVGSLCVCLDTRSPVGVDCKFGSEAEGEGDSERQQRRIQEKICTGGESRQDHLIDEKGSRSWSFNRQRIQESFYIDRRREVRHINSGGSRRRYASAGSHGRIKSWTRKDQGVDLHRQESFYIDRRRKGGSEHRHRMIQEKICIGEEPRQDHLIGKKESRSGFALARDRGDLLRHQGGGDEIFYIYRYQVVEFLVISNSSRCNLGLFPSGVGSVWVYLDTGSPVGMDCKFESEAADEGDSEH